METKIVQSEISQRQRQRVTYLSSKFLSLIINIKDYTFYSCTYKYLTLVFRSVNVSCMAFFSNWIVLGCVVAFRSAAASWLRSFAADDWLSRSQIVRTNECQDPNNGAATQYNHNGNGTGGHPTTSNLASGVNLQNHYSTSSSSSYKASKTLRMPSAPINSAEQTRLLG